MKFAPAVQIFIDLSEAVLYNIYTDPAETSNVIKQYPDVARKLKNMIGGQRVENARFHF